MSGEHKSRPSAFRVLILLAVAAMLIAYRVLWPWAPFWIDAVIILAGIGAFLLSRDASSSSASFASVSADDPSRKQPRV